MTFIGLQVLVLVLTRVYVLCMRRDPIVFVVVVVLLLWWWCCVVLLLLWWCCVVVLFTLQIYLNCLLFCAVIYT
jgi:hypothetical protein